MKVIKIIQATESSKGIGFYQDCEYDLFWRNERLRAANEQGIEVLLDTLILSGATIKVENI